MNGVTNRQRLADNARDRQAMSARSGSRQTEMRFAVGDCALDAVLLARSEWGVCAILFGDDREALPHELKARSPQALLRNGDPACDALISDLTRFIDAPSVGFNPPLDMRGAPTAARAVAAACAANPLAVAVPCHRVVRNEGALPGYRWGVARKRKLLSQERAYAAEQPG